MADTKATSATSASDSTNAQVLYELEVLMLDEFFPELRRGQKFYYPLPAEGFTRLLTLRAGSGNTLLAGSLNIVPISGKSNDYEALSYAWGLPKKTHRLRVDGRSLPISASLHAALLQLRNPNVSRTLWVDAVCINQDDNEEKATQVLQMSKIYSSASCVLCWLGEDAEQFGADTLKLIREIGHADFTTLEGDVVTASHMEGQKLPACKDDRWLFALLFFQRPWFRRSWVVQEFVYGRDVQFVCGTAQVGWKDLRGGLEIMTDYSLLDWGTGLALREEVNEANIGLRALRMMADTRSYGSWSDMYANVFRSFLSRDDSAQQEVEVLGLEQAVPGTRALLRFARAQKLHPAMGDLLGSMMSQALPLLGCEDKTGCSISLAHQVLRFATSIASDPRDKLFAFLSLSSERHEPALRPNYSEPAASVFIRYTRFFLQSDGGALLNAIFANAGLISHTGALALPSWTPEYSRVSLKPDYLVSFGINFAHCYKAAGTRGPRLRLPQGSPPTLSITGSRLGRITRLIDIAAVTNESFEPSIQAIKTFFTDVDSLISARRQSVLFQPSGETLFEVQWRTLIANVGDRPVLAEASYVSSYRATRAWIDSLGPHDELLKSEFPGWFRRWCGVVRGCAVCELQGGAVGLAPRGAVVGDLLAVFLGVNMPLVLRFDDKREGAVRLVGIGYVHGVMHGEALEWEGWKEEEFDLV